MKNCPICGSELNPTKSTSTFRIKDHSVSKEVFELTSCTDCEILHTNFNENKNISDYYAGEDYASHNLSYLNPVHLLYGIARTFTLRGKKRLVGKISNGKRILDYGCGTGDFLSVMNKAGWSTTGYEPSQKAREEASRKNIQELWGNENQITGPYDIITLWHVLEHTSNPKETVTILKQKLSKGGTIIIAVPNYKSFDAEMYKDFWAGYDVPRHLWHFSEKSISNLADSVGLTIQRILPMKLDAYYVSLLSEKYRNSGKQSLSTYFRAIKIGYSSNKKAEKTGESSSKIYILTQ